MKVINKKMCVVCLLVIIEISSLFLMYKSNSNKEIKLDSVENKEINNSGLAIMIEQTLGTYSQYTTTNTWPSDTTYVLNTLKSGCVDSDGNKVKDGMTFDKQNRKIILNTNKTSSCYAYFTRSTKYKVEHAESVWDSDLEGDGYRYYGNGITKDSETDPKNYVCFGTQSKNECVNDNDKYMYRIIGMFQEETISGGYNTIDPNSAYHLKLIKKEALNAHYAWHSNNTTDTNWSASDLYKGLNGNYFVTNMDYSYMRDNYWYSKIMNWKWNAVNTKTYSNSGLNYFSETSSSVYLDEMNRNTKSSSVSVYENVMAKIGLMNTSDYKLSLGSVAKDYKNGNANFKKGWIYITNNDSATSSLEWQLTRNGIYNEENNAWHIGTMGYIMTASVDYKFSVRPVFYLNSDVVICSGTGTSTDPYILG